MVFEDNDADARFSTGETGLPGLRVRVAHSLGAETLAADGSGVVTVTLPGPGVYAFDLLDRPRPGQAWRETTRSALEVRVGEDGSLAILSGGGKALPIGLAPGAAFAFGLAKRPVSVVFPLGVAGFLLITAIIVALDRRAEAIRSLERALKNP